jgi:hypothetical protein
MEPYSFNQRVENLYKSYFGNEKNVNIELGMNQIDINLIEDNNFDSASLQLKIVEGCFLINFWDGYSQSEIVEVFTERDAAKTLKRFMKKLLKILNR